MNTITSQAVKAPPTSVPTVPILGIPISAINLPMAWDHANRWILEKNPHYICVREVNGLMEAIHDPELKKIHYSAGLITPDGMPLAWICRWRGHRQVERVCGRDLLLYFCRQSVVQGYRHFFYGGPPGVADQLAKRLKEKVPDLLVAGTLSPPFSPLSPSEDQQILNQIQASGADIVWVGLSSPKQEFWMRDHIGKLQACVLIGVGAAFDFHAGTRPVAPTWMQQTGLEWLFRLMTEPRRLWKRYLINSPLFLFLLVLELLGLKKFDSQASHPPTP